jgi:hypothetical protein
MTWSLCHVVLNASINDMRRSPREILSFVLVALLMFCSGSQPATAFGSDGREWVDVRFEYSPGFERIIPGRRFMFFHHHVPKTAGRSLYRYFLREGHPEGIEPCAQVVRPEYQPGETHCLLYGGHDNFCNDLVLKLKEEQKRTSNYETCNLLSFESRNLTWDLTYHLTMPSLKVVTMFREPLGHYLSQFMHDRAWKRVSTMAEYLSQSNDRGYNIAANGNLIHQRLGVQSLQEAKNILLNRLFFFGFMEYWLQSLCLLSYQLNQFDRITCNLCHREDLNEPPENLSMSEQFFIGSMRVGVKTEDTLSEASLTAQDIRRVQEINADDMHLYTWAVEIFKARLRIIERTERVRMLCDE